MSEKQSNTNPSYENDEFKSEDLENIRRMRELCMSLIEGSEELARVIGSLKFELNDYLEAAPNFKANLSAMLEELKKFQIDIGE